MSSEPKLDSIDIGHSFAPPLLIVRKNVAYQLPFFIVKHVITDIVAFTRGTNINFLPLRVLRPI